MEGGDEADEAEAHDEHDGGGDLEARSIVGGRRSEAAEEEDEDVRRLRWWPESRA